MGARNINSGHLLLELSYGTYVPPFCVEVVLQTDDLINESVCGLPSLALHKYMEELHCRLARSDDEAESREIVTRIKQVSADFAVGFAAALSTLHETMPMNLVHALTKLEWTECEECMETGAP